MKRLHNLTIKEFCNILLEFEITEELSQIELDDLSIYNYLEKITNNWDENRVRIVLKEMDFYYSEYLEEITVEVHNIYIDNGWELPTKPCVPRITPFNKSFIQSKPILETVTDWRKMIEKIYPCRDFTYHQTVMLLKTKLPPKQPQPEAQITAHEPQQKDLHYYCQKAIEKGYLVKEVGGYRRVSWSKAQLAYFLGHFLKPNDIFPDNEYCLMFGENRLGKALGQLINNKTGNGKPKGYEVVDTLLKE